MSHEGLLRASPYLSRVFRQMAAQQIETRRWKKLSAERGQIDTLADELSFGGGAGS